MVKDSKHLREKRSRLTWLRYAVTVGLGIASLYFGHLSKPNFPVVSTLLSEGGVVLLSITVALWIHQLFGGDPQLQELSKDLKEHLTGAHIGTQCVTFGISAVYEKRKLSRFDALDDLGKSDISCRMYAAVYLSEIHQDEQFGEAITNAAVRAGKEGRDYTFSYCSLNPDPEPNGNKVLLDYWSKREGDTEVASLQYRIKRGHDAFNAMVEKVIQTSGARLKASKRYFAGYMVPHSMLIIDDQIIYISFYDWEHKRGDENFTIRLDGGAVASHFLAEAKKLDQCYSVSAV